MKNTSKNLILTSLFAVILLTFSHQVYASTVTKTLYAWARDLAGNISAYLSDSVDITINTYYISPSGNDTTGTGSISNPWKTLYKACNSVTTPGSTIHVNEGTYVEDQKCDLAVGVSIEGEGVSSIIKSHYITTRGGNIINGSIALVSPTEGTNGNQSISNIKLDGDNMTGSIAIAVKNRSNVKIHDLTIVDFYINGVTFTGANSGTYSKPNIYATGNELYNTIITNCGDADTTWDGGAILQWSGQDGLLVYNNIFNNTLRAEGHNGNIVNASYYVKGVKYYNNKSYKPDYDGSGWNFHIESWNNEGGMEIYNNEFYGGDSVVDIAGHFNTKGSYPYSTSVHDNLFFSSSTDISNFKNGIHIEANLCEDVEIYNNIFTGLAHPFGIYDGGVNSPNTKNRIYIYRNLIQLPTFGSGVTYFNIINVVGTNTSTVWSDIFIYNNTILSSNTQYTTAIKIIPMGTINNLNIKNNIFVGHRNGTFLNVVNNGSINGLYVDYNLLFNNAGNNNPTLSGNSVINYSFLNNILSNPLFISSTDFHLQQNSPAIDSGIDVGLPYYGSAPDLGAFETNY